MDATAGDSSASGTQRPLSAVCPSTAPSVSVESASQPKRSAISSRRMAEIMVATGLVLALAAIGYQFLLPVNLCPKSVTAQPTGSSTVAVPTTAGDSQPTGSFTVVAEDGRPLPVATVSDPLPATHPVVPSNTYRLGGVFRSEDGAFAVINDIEVNVGAKVNGARVVRIDTGSVLLEKDGKQFTLRLN